MLTFEVESADEALHIHADVEGLKALAAIVQSLANSVEMKGPDHVHLMTPAWGGHELSNEPQSDNSTLYHHVKLHGWR